MKKLVVLLILTTCTWEVFAQQAVKTKFDQDTEYLIYPNGLGFGLVVEYSKYQFVPSQTEISRVCLQKISEVAKYSASLYGQDIEVGSSVQPNIQISRQPLTGVTTCTAQAIVFWNPVFVGW